MNSTRTSDSASFVDAGDGSSGGTIGPPYVIAGTFRHNKVTETKTSSKIAHLACWVHLPYVPLRFVRQVDFVSLIRRLGLFQGHLHLPIYTAVS
jgi:hypothetical protein